MKDENIMECAGNLFQEINEISNIISEKDSIEQVLSHTAACSTFLTIYCC